MKKKYVEDIPFEYKKYTENKAIELSDSIIQEFNSFYDDIKQDKYEVSSKDASRLLDMPIKKQFDEIKDLVAAEVRKSGNKKSIYVDEYVNFIFGVCFL